MKKIEFKISDAEYIDIQHGRPITKFISMDGKLVKVTMVEDY